MSYFRENIEELEGYTPGFQPKETDIIKLNTNENPYPPSDKAIHAIRTIEAEKLRRYPEPLADSFRVAASEILGVKPDNIICSNGGDDLLTIAVRSFCDETGPLACLGPTYSLYPVLAGIQGAPYVEVPFGENFSISEQLKNTGAALTIVCNPNAPSGSFIEKEKLADLASKLDGVLLIDEAYADFAEDNCISLINDFDNVIILRSMSKGYSLAGLRFGFGIACEQLITGMRKVKDSYNVDAVAIATASEAIKDQDYFLQNVGMIKQQRRFLSEELEKLGLKVYPNSTNFILVEHEQAALIHNELVSRHIYVRYFGNLTAMQDKLRITVGTAEQVQKLISALKQILSK